MVVSEYIGWAGVAAMVVVAVVGGRYALAGQRHQARTNETVAKIQARSQEGRLALDMAIETRDRLDIMEDWEDDVREWWNNEHRPRDEIRDQALRAANPDILQNLPPLTPMPSPKRRRET